MSRRNFLKVSAATAAVGASASAARADVHPPGWRGDTRVQQIATNCEMCFWRCGVMAEVADGKVLKLQGNPNHPLTKGKLCARGNAGTALLYDPDRLKYPQIRTGERGEGKFRRVGWDEALDFLGAHLKQLKDKYGAESRGAVSARRAFGILRHLDESLWHAELGGAGICAMSGSA